MENRDKLHPAIILPTDADATHTTTPALRQGNTRDDDALALDEYFEAAEHKAIEYGKLITPVPKEIAAATRIVTRSYIIAPVDASTAAPPIQVLPRDLNRTRLFIVCGPADFAAWQFGSEMSDVYGAPVMTANLASGGYDLSGHTGALWIYNPSLTVTLTARIWTVTR